MKFIAHAIVASGALWLSRGAAAQAPPAPCRRHRSRSLCRDPRRTATGCRSMPARSSSRSTARRSTPSRARTVSCISPSARASRTSRRTRLTFASIETFDAATGAIFGETKAVSMSGADLSRKVFRFAAATGVADAELLGNPRPRGGRCALPRCRRGRRDEGPRSPRAPARQHHGDDVGGPDRLQDDGRRDAGELRPLDRPLATPEGDRLGRRQRLLPDRLAASLGAHSGARHAAAGRAVRDRLRQARRIRPPLFRREDKSRELVRLPRRDRRSGRGKRGRGGRRPAQWRSRQGPADGGRSDGRRKPRHHRHGIEPLRALRAPRPGQHPRQGRSEGRDGRVAREARATPATPMRRTCISMSPTGPRPSTRPACLSSSSACTSRVARKVLAMAPSIPR